MALRKTITTPHGVTADYHKLARIEINFNEQKAEAIIESYTNEESRRTGNLHIASARCRWDKTYFPFTDDAPTRNQFYTEIKKHSAWAAAENC